MKPEKIFPFRHRHVHSAGKKQTWLTHHLLHTIFLCSNIKGNITWYFKFSLGATKCIYLLSVMYSWLLSCTSMGLWDRWNHLPPIVESAVWAQPLSLHIFKCLRARYWTPGCFLWVRTCMRVHANVLIVDCWCNASIGGSTYAKTKHFISYNKTGSSDSDDN